MGAASNQAVLNANHDKFPVEVNTFKEEIMVYKMQQEWKDATADIENAPSLPEGMIDDTHCIMTEYTHLNWLADVFDLKDGIYSIGDFLLMLGGYLWTFAPFVWVFEATRRLNRQE